MGKGSDCAAVVAGSQGVPATAVAGEQQPVKAEKVANQADFYVNKWLSYNL